MRVMKLFQSTALVLRLPREGQVPSGRFFVRVHASFFGYGSKLRVMRRSSCVCGLTVLAYPSWQVSNVVLAILLGGAFDTTPCAAGWEGTG